jgi:signal transduction histidine kinase
MADALDTLLMFRDLRESERELKGSRSELAASRARIVAAGDETRRQIERDLHDGVQQRLVSLALAQRRAEAMVPSDLRELRAQLSGVVDGLTGALDELQEISRGIHPAILANGGLVPALKTLARRSAVPVQLEVRAGTRLPEPVEVAAYYVVSEALTNTAKHAHASAVQVALEARDGVLGLSIRDNGRGGADPARGSGLIGLTDRVDALGGTIEVASPAGQGTTLLITLPIEDASQHRAGTVLPGARLFPRGIE